MFKSRDDMNANFYSTAKESHSSPGHDHLAPSTGLKSPLVVQGVKYFQTKHCSFIAFLSPSSSQPFNKEIFATKKRKRCRLMGNRFYHNTGQFF